jgi:hypothetical protein
VSDLLEALSGVGAGVHIWVQFASKLAIGLLDLF